MYIEEFNMFERIIQVVLFGIALSMDAFMVSITQGLTFNDLNKKKSVFIAFIYGFFQALFPIIGFFLIELLTWLVGESSEANLSEILKAIISWTAFGLLVFLGVKMIIEAVKEQKKDESEKTERKFTVKEVLIMGVVTAIDALATGIAFHNTSKSGVPFSTSVTIFNHAIIIMVITFIICIIGLILARQINKLLKGKYEKTGMIGGIILISLGIWILLSHYFNI